MVNKTGQTLRCNEIGLGAYIEAEVASYKTSINCIISTMCQRDEQCSNTRKVLGLAKKATFTNYANVALSILYSVESSKLIFCCSTAGKAPPFSLNAWNSLVLELDFLFQGVEKKLLFFRAWVSTSSPRRAWDSPLVGSAYPPKNLRSSWACFLIPRYHPVEHFHRGMLCCFLFLLFLVLAVPVLYAHYLSHFRDL